MLVIFFMMAYGVSNQGSYMDTDSPFYRQMREQELDHLKRELENADQESKVYLQQMISDIEYEMEVGYEKAREVQLIREREELKLILEDENITNDTSETILLRLETIEAALEFGERSPQVAKLELKTQLASLESRLEGQLSHRERVILESQKREIELRLKQTQTDRENNAFSLLIRYFIDTSGFFLPLIIILVASEAISGEYSLGTIKLLLIKPFTRTKLYLSKYIALMLYGLFVFVFLSVIGFGIGGLFVGYGGAGLTRIIGQARIDLGREYGFMIDYSSAYLVSNFQYLLYILGLFMLTLAVTIAFSMLVSVFTKSATISLVATMGLIFVGQIVSSIFYQKTWVKYLLMPHFNIISHLEGNFWFPGVTLAFSIGALVIYAAVCLGAGIFGFKKKDII